MLHRALKLAQRVSNASAPTLEAKRKAWAEAIRAPLRAYPEQWAALSSPAKLKAICGNRRAGKTEGWGRWDLADMVEQDNLTVTVWTEHLKEYSRNWLLRRGKATGAIELLNSLGVPYRARMLDKDTCTSIEFDWGSKVDVLPAEHAGQVEDARGLTSDRFRGDEVQKMDLVQDIIREMVGPAGADFDAEVLLSGTPGSEVDTYFHRIASGVYSQRESHSLRSTLNPRFGETFEERYYNAVISRLELLQETYCITDEQLEILRDLSEEQFMALGLSEEEDLEPALRDLARRQSRPDAIVPPLDATVLREYYGRWVAEASEYVYAARACDPATLYWAPRPLPETRHDETEAVIKQRWVGLIGRLPKVPVLGIRERLKRWQVILPYDLGYSPDPFAWVPMLCSLEDDTLYELDSGKANELDSDMQLAIIEKHVRVCNALDLPVAAVIVDASGGGTVSLTRGWARKLRPLFKYAMPAIVEAGFSGGKTGTRTNNYNELKANKWPHIKVLNAEMLRGKVRGLEGSPLDVEQKYLKKVFRNPKRPELGYKEDKMRSIRLPDGSEIVPGNHCCDLRLYAWRWACHRFGRMPDSENTRDRSEAVARMRKAELE